MIHEAQKFTVPIELDGVKCNLFVRAFIVDGRLMAIRTAQIRTLDNERIKMVTDGKLTDAELDVPA